MPNAIRTDTSLSQTITQANLVAAIKTAMGNAGFGAIYGEQSATSHRIVYQVVFDASKTKGTLYFEVQITTGLAVTGRISDNYNLTNYSATGQSTSASTTFTAVTGTSINFVAINHPELRAVILTQGSTIYFLGYVRPATKPSWWNEDSHLYCLNIRSTTLTDNGLCSPNPYNNVLNNYVYVDDMDGQLSTANTITNKRDIVSKPLLFANTSVNPGLYGQMSADIVQCASNGLSRWDVMQVSPSTEEYLLLNPGNDGIAIRIV